MKYVMLFISLLFVHYAVIAQPLLRNEAPASSGNNTYAIVIGISNYQDPDIRKLLFSNRDALVFADFLMSAPGGSVPKQNIKLLIDSVATIGEVDRSIRWLMNNCKENDRVYFYFSGHGEMENVTMSKNGYLICYNTPSVAFVNMGLSIDYLNDIVNTISVGTKAKVIVITDACHSGTVAGNKFKGNFFVGEQLMLKNNNEIRMASCKPDELSNEKADWGGGRGVFSYYLVNGLQGGLADNNKDLVVSVGELKKFMEYSMAKDLVLKNEGDLQTPVIKGDDDFVLATVVESETKKIKELVKNDSIVQVMVMSTMPGAVTEDDAGPSDYFFEQLKKQNLEFITDNLKLNTIAADSIAFTLINAIKNSVTTASGKNKIRELEKALRTDKEDLTRFNLDIAGAFLDIGQNVISNYIRGDEAELERRRYYNSKKNDYDVYTRMFEVAFKLTKDEKYYHTKAEVFLHYFSGLALRLKIPLTEDPGPLIKMALAEQNKALALMEHAAYIYNELGVLYHYKNDLAKAAQNFIKASALSPGWAIPVSNLSSLYIDEKNYSKALLYADSADILQQDLQSTSINRGIINEKTANLLFAEEDYRKAIDINSRHFIPFDRLGYLYMNTTHYAVADSFFYEADLRKQGYHFKENAASRVSDLQMLTPSFNYYCSFNDTLQFKPDDMLAWFAWGMAEFYAFNTGKINADGVAPHVTKNNAGAIQKFRKVISLGKQNPMVYHYLGIAYYEQQQWEEAELMFRYAMEQYMNPETFKQYLDSVKKSAVYPYEHECYENLYSNFYYPQAHDLYFLASIYEKWRQPVEAETYYKKIIENGTRELGVYMKLWQLLEKQGLYLQAEHVLKNCETFYRDTIYRELNAFYRRTIEKEPETADWYYKLGLLLYNHAHEPTVFKGTDTIIWYPKINKERFVPEFTWNTSLDETGKMVPANKITNWEDFSLDTGPGTSDKLIKEDEVHQKSEHIMVPGTGQILSLAENVVYPRFDGILYLKRAAELISEKETLASINFKIAEIYEWAGSKKMAYPYFERSLALDQVNANTRIKLVDLYTALYKNRAALKQLEYLNDSSQINFGKRLQFAGFKMLAGNFAEADSLLNKANLIQPYVLPEMLNLQGLSYQLAIKPREAIASYEKSLAVQQADPWFNNYSIARLYAKNGNSTRAWKYLTRAVDLGFNYSFVLQNDSYLKSLRKTAKWQKLISGINMKKYKQKKTA